MNRDGSRVGLASKIMSNHSTIMAQILAPIEDEIFSFISIIGSSVHLCAIHPDSGDVQGRFFGADTASATEWSVYWNNKGYGIYWTVNIVSPDCGKKPSKEQITGLRAIHIDVDPPKNGSTFDKEAKAAELNAANPTLLVDSGNGVQAFCMLSEIIPATPENIAEAEAIGRRVIFEFGGDACTFNIDRLMRVAGTVNLPNAKKREAGRVPVMARVIVPFDHVRLWTPADILARWPAPPPSDASPGAFAMPDAPPSPISGPVDAETLADLRSAVVMIDPDCDYDTWLRMMSAAKSLGPQGRPLAIGWSHMSPNAIPGEPERKWEEVRADRTDYRAIFAEAQRRGWRNLRAKPPAAQWQFPSQSSSLRAYENGVSAAALMAKDFSPVRYLVPGYIPEGLTLLVGAPKTCKSWMALGLCIAVGGGLAAFDAISVDVGDALYLALEDNERRLKKRINKMGMVPSERVTLVTNWPDLDNGCVAELEAWIDSVENPKLIIVDVLNKVRGRTGGREQQYEADYKTLSTLHELASRRAVSIIVLHHTRKLDADDPFDLVSGTRGLTGAADTILVLRKPKSSEEATLYGRGRDIQEFEAVMRFDGETCHWQMRGDAAAFAKTAERQEILDLLIDAKAPMTPTMVAEKLGKDRSNVNHLMLALVKDGQAVSEGGLYTPIHSVHPGRWGE
jgi:hypothetical protein